MKIKISYFYKVRFFKPNEIPVSTALFDPKWYYNKSQGNWYIDKRGVVNGLRQPLFAPGPRCEGLCHGKDGCKHSPETCDFLQMYHVQLKHLNFENELSKLEALGRMIQSVRGFKEDPVIVLLVHETPDNPCSERSMLIKWFKENNYELKEYNENVSD